MSAESEKELYYKIMQLLPNAGFSSWAIGKINSTEFQLIYLPEYSDPKYMMTGDLEYLYDYCKQKFVKSN